MPRKSYKEKRAEGLCPFCGKPNPNPRYALCIDCRMKRSRQSYDNRQYFIKNGYCSACGKKKEDPDKRLCEACRENRRSSKQHKKITAV